MVDSVEKVELADGRYQPLAASYYIRTPPKVALIRAVVNINNTVDQMRFLWSVLANCTRSNYIKTVFQSTLTQ